MSHPSRCPAHLFRVTACCSSSYNSSRPARQQSPMPETTASKAHEEHRTWDDLPAAGCSLSRFQRGSSYKQLAEAQAQGSPRVSASLLGQSHNTPTAQMGDPSASHGKETNYTEIPPIGASTLSGHLLAR